MPVQPLECPGPPDGAVAGGRGGRRLGGKARCSEQAGGDGETDLRAEPATGDNVPAESGRGGVQAVGEGEGETAGQIKER